MNSKKMIKPNRRRLRTRIADSELRMRFSGIDFKKQEIVCKKYNRHLCCVSVYQDAKLIVSETKFISH